MANPLNRSAFKKLWLANALSRIGSEIGCIGLLLYIFGEQRDVVVIASYLLCRAMPGILFSPIAGHLVDRYNKRNVMIASDLLRIIGLVAIIIVPTVPSIYFFTFIMATATIVFEPAKKATIQIIVPPQELYEANAIDRSATAIVAVAGPLIGVVLFSVTGLTLTLIADVLTFALSALLIATMSLPKNTVAISKLSIKKHLLESLQGIRHARSNPLLRYLLGFSFISMLCVGVWIPLAPFFITQTLNVSSEALALSLSCFGMGGILGGLMSSKFAKRFGIGPLLHFALVAESVALIAYSLVPSLTISLLILLVWGVIVSVIAISQQSILQLAIPQHLTGRVFSTLQQVEDIALILALLLVIVVRDLLSASVIFFSMGLAYFILNLVGSKLVGRSILQREYSAHRSMVVTA